MRIRKQFLAVTEVTDKAFIALETKNPNIPEWKIDYTIEKLNEIMDWVVDMGEEDESFFKKLIPGLETVIIDRAIGTIGITELVIDDRVTGTLYYGAARDCMLDMFNGVEEK